MEVSVQQKRNTVYSVITGLLVLLFSLFTGGQQTFAAELEGTGNTANDAIITTVDGDKVTEGEKLNKYVYFDATYHWSLPKDTVVKNGDTLAFTLPSNVQIRVADTQFDVKNDQGAVVGTFNIKKGERTGYLTFNDYFEKNKLSDIHGVLTITVSGTEENSPSDWFLNKSGWLDDQKRANWTVIYNPKSLHLTNVTIKDTLENNQYFDLSSVQLWYGTVDENNQFVATKKITDPIAKGLVTVKGNVMTAKFDQLDQAIQFVYRSKVWRYDDQLKLVNKVESNSDELGSQMMTSTIELGGSGVADGVQNNKPGCRPQPPCHHHHHHHHHCYKVIYGSGHHIYYKHVCVSH